MLNDLEAVLRRMEEGEGFEKAVNKVHAVLADSFGAPKIPDVKWEDVGKAKGENVNYANFIFNFF